MLSQMLRFDPDHLPHFARNATKFMIWGVVLMILGALAVSFAYFSTLVTVALIGFFLFFTGVVTLADTFTFWWSKWSGFLTHLIFGLLYLIVGILLLNNPLEGSVSLTLILGIFYIFLGVMRTIYALSAKAPHWKWNLFSGIVALILGILITISWPESSIFVIGLFVGIDLFFTGWAYFMAALAAKNMAR